MPSMEEKQPLLSSPSSSRYVLVIHGGAGTILREDMTPAKRAAFTAALRQSLAAGYALLKQGADAMDAVVAAVTVMEDNPLFNAGKGAVFNLDGKNELEASIMLSKPPKYPSNIPPSRRGVGATLLTRAKNPSQLVRALYLSPSLAPHTFFSGKTAEDVGQELGQTLVDPSYFFTSHRWREHRRGLGLPEKPLPPHDDPDDVPFMHEFPKGTVGAVALDVHGCIAVLTSTGGRTNKLVGRIGDTPLMGAGFWAEEWKPTRSAWGWLQRCLGRPPANSVGVSGTGDGDYFIRRATAATIANRMKFGNVTLNDATELAVKELFEDGGLGGVIALDNQGTVSMSLNCPGMYRGVIREDGIAKTAIFSDEELQE